MPAPLSAPRLVLLVEDEPTIAVTLTDDLEDHGCAVVHTANGDEAIALLRGREFAAVITDLNLPGASGLEVVRAARRVWPGTPVLVVTACANGRAQELRGAGAEVLEKPFPNADVLAWLARPAG